VIVPCEKSVGARGLYLYNNSNSHVHQLGTVGDNMVEGYRNLRFAGHM